MVVIPPRIEFTHPFKSHQISVWIQLALSDRHLEATGNLKEVSRMPRVVLGARFFDQRHGRSRMPIAHDAADQGAFMKRRIVDP